MDRERIVAVGLLSQRDLDRLGTSFERAFPVEGGGDFEDLLAAIDAAERASRADQTPGR
ncbi:MAG: hypothetical protein JWR77_1964 [Rhizorhabdus sp.]|nr:hypothetical protein [Rhizorhabdus sp.]